MTGRVLLLTAAPGPVCERSAEAGHTVAPKLTLTVGTLNAPMPMAVGTAVWVMTVVLMLMLIGLRKLPQAAGATRSSSFSIRNRALWVAMDDDSLNGEKQWGNRRLPPGNSQDLGRTVPG